MNFRSHQCVEIKNAEEFKTVYQYLRSAQFTPFEEYIKDGMPSFPLYLEKANSVTRGESIGYTHIPVDTWTKNELEIIPLEEALKN